MGSYKLRARLNVEGMEIHPGENLSIANTFCVKCIEKNIEFLDEYVLTYYLFHSFSFFKMLPTSALENNPNQVFFYISKHKMSYPLKTMVSQFQY